MAPVLLCLWLCFLTNNKSRARAFSIPTTVTNYKCLDETNSNRDSFASFVTMRTGIDLERARQQADKTNAHNCEGGGGGGGGDSQDEQHQQSPGSSDVVFWMGEGHLYESPSGNVIAKVEGFDASRGIYMSDHHIRQFSRKIFWFRDPETNELIKEYKGKPVRPIRYDWQVFDFKRGTSSDNGDPSMVPILPTVLKGPRSVPCMPVTPRYAGKDVILFQCPLFINVETANGPYQAWEIYDYTLDLSHDVVNRPPSLSWSRQGSNPPFLEDGNGVMHFLGHRYDRFEDLPQHIKDLVNDDEEDYGLFRAPPLNMEEIHLLEAKMLSSKKLSLITNRTIASASSSSSSNGKMGIGNKSFLS